MLKWAIIFAVIALIAGALGFTGVAAGAAGIAKILFVVFLVLFVAVLLFALLGAKAVAGEIAMGQTSAPMALADAGPGRLELDQNALDAAKRSLEKGAVTPSYGPWREDIIRLLNGALATEIVCTLRYKRHYYTAKGVASPAIADEFLVHANEETAHADQLAERIVQLGGEPDFAPSTLMERSHAEYDESQDLQAMIRANLIAERVAIEAYSQMIALIGDKDTTTRRILESILSQEQEHADELSDWLTD